jgi:hypothetical protein
MNHQWNLKFGEVSLGLAGASFKFRTRKIDT